MVAMRILVTGASGAGVTTLGRALARCLGAGHLDIDDYDWLPTDPPYRIRRPTAERLRLLSADLQASPHWVMSGSPDGWGEPLLADATLAVLVDTPTDLRLARLRAREAARFGDRIRPGGDMAEQHADFLAWAEGYDTGACTSRNRARHARWLAALGLPLAQVSGLISTDEQVAWLIARAVVRGPAGGRDPSPTEA